MQEKWDCGDWLEYIGWELVTAQQTIYSRDSQQDRGQVQSYRFASYAPMGSPNAGHSHPGHRQSKIHERNLSVYSFELTEEEMKAIGNLQEEEPGKLMSVKFTD